MIKFKQLSLIFQTCFDGTSVIFSVTYFETNCPFEFDNTKNFAALSNYSSFNMAATLKIYLKHALLVSGDHIAQIGFDQISPLASSTRASLCTRSNFSLPSPSWLRMLPI